MVKRQLTLDVFSRTEFLAALNPTQIKIIQHLQSGYYAAIAARRLNVSGSYVSRFVNKLLEHGLIAPSYKDPLCRRAQVYTVSEELSDFLAGRQQKDETGYTLLTPHNIRFKRKIVAKVGDVQTSINRFAHAKYKFLHEYFPRGGKRLVFEMQGRHGRIKMVVHGSSSVEGIVVDRQHVPARNEEEAEAVLVMELEDAFNRFVDEQRWCGTRIKLGQPVKVGSTHYAFRSKILKDEFVRKGETKLKITPTLEIDNSPEDHGDRDHAELETQVRSEAVRFDESLRMVPRVMGDLQNLQHSINSISDQSERIDQMYKQVEKMGGTLDEIPQVMSDLKDVQKSMTGFSEQSGRFEEMYNNVQALCQSGLPLQNQFNQLTSIVSQQGRSIALMQETMLEVVKNMGRILEKMDTK